MSYFDHSNEELSDLVEEKTSYVKKLRIQKDLNHLKSGLSIYTSTLSFGFSVVGTYHQESPFLVSMGLAGSVFLGYLGVDYFKKLKKSYEDWYDQNAELKRLKKELSARDYIK